MAETSCCLFPSDVSHRRRWMGLSFVFVRAFFLLHAILGVPLRGKEICIVIVASWVTRACAPASFRIGARHQTDRERFPKRRHQQQPNGGGERVHTDMQIVVPCSGEKRKGGGGRGHLVREIHRGACAVCVGRPDRDSRRQAPPPPACREVGVTPTVHAVVAVSFLSPLSTGRVWGGTSPRGTPGHPQDPSRGAPFLIPAVHGGRVGGSCVNQWKRRGRALAEYYSFRGVRDCAS